MSLKEKTKNDRTILPEQLLELYFDGYKSRYSIVGEEPFIYLMNFDGFKEAVEDLIKNRFGSTEKQHP